MHDLPFPGEFISQLRTGPTFAAKRLNTGFSLIEVLISMIVLSIGVIGTVGMQVTALRTIQQSAFQTRASQIAADMADAIRASMLKAGGNGEAISFPQLDYKASNEVEPTPPASLCYVKVCDPQAYVDFEIYEWKKRIHSDLPGGRVMICYDAQPWEEATKHLKWSCNGAPGSDAPLVIKLGWQLKNPDGSLVKDAEDGYPPSVALAVAPA